MMSKKDIINNILVNSVNKNIYTIDGGVLSMLLYLDDTYIFEKDLYSMKYKDLKILLNAINSQDNLNILRNRVNHCVVWYLNFSFGYVAYNNIMIRY